MSPIAIAGMVAMFVVCVVAVVAMLAVGSDADDRAQEMLRKRRPQP